MYKLTLTLVLLCLATAEKGIATVDVIELNLQQNGTKEYTQILEEHHDWALMANVQMIYKGTSLGQFDITMTNKNGESVECQFKYMSNLCVIEHSTEEVKISIKCISAQCNSDLLISQRIMYTFQGDNTHQSKILTVPGQILKLQKDSFNTIIELFSQLSEKQLRAKQITVFSNVHAFQLGQIQELGSNSVVFGLKPILKEIDRYLFIQSSKDDNLKLRAIVKAHQGMLKDGVPVVDFIETYGHHKVNVYGAQMEFKKQMQVSARIFEGNGIPFSIIVQGRAKAEDKSTQIAALHLDKLDFQGQKIYDLAFCITKSHYQGYKFIDFSFLIDKEDNKTIFIQFTVTDVDNFEIDIFDDVYFSSIPNQLTKYFVKPQIKYEILGGDKDIAVLTKPEQQYFTNTASCSLHTGCEIEIKSTKQCKPCNFNFDLKDQHIKNHLIFYAVKDNEIEATIDYEEQLFFKRLMPPGKVTQILVNTQNVMIYANFQNYKRCKLPTASCHQFVINQQYPMKLANSEEQAQALILGVVGFEKTEFKVRFVESSGGLKVALGQKFSYMFDNEVNQIAVSFTVTNSTFSETDSHLYFNLISPTNSLRLAVSNQDGVTRKGSDGYLQFSKKDILSDHFTITITKLGSFVGNFVHMTLIVTTSESSVRLDATNTHYQKYQPMTQKKFVLQYDPREKTVVNVFSDNLEKNRCKMLASIYQITDTDGLYGEVPKVIKKELLSNNQAMDIGEQLQVAGLCEDINCQLEIAMTNDCKESIEQSLTLLHEESVILIEDSIWNSFQINQLSVKNHFYFIPRQKAKTINLLFTSENKDIYLDYVIYNSKNNINPQNWPWTHHTPDPKNTPPHLSGYQQFKIPGQSQVMKQCWPHCVILMTVNVANPEALDFSENALVKSYKVLVSSTVIEAPEDTNFMIVMEAGEENTMFVQLKNFMKSSELTFFTDYKVGRANVTASLMSLNAQYKLGHSGSDFYFQDVETHLPISNIQMILNNQKIELEFTSLKITFKAVTFVKLYFEFSSYMGGFTRLKMDDLQVANLREGETSWYEFIPQRDYSIKFYRARGFPMFKVMECSEENYTQCLDKKRKWLNNQLKMKKKLEQVVGQGAIQNLKTEQQSINSLEVFVDKNYETFKTACDRCVVFIWVYAFSKDVQLSINIRTSQTEIQLKEMAVINDRIEKANGHNKYLMNVEYDKNTQVSFRVMEGSCRVEIVDGNNLLYNSTFNAVDKDYQDITLEALQLHNSQDKEEDTVGGDIDDWVNMRTPYQPVRLSKKKMLRYIHIKVVSLDIKPTDYLISYSMDRSAVVLEDGIVMKKEMLPDIPHTFYYHNNKKESHAYLTLSSTVRSGFDAANSKNEYDVKFFYFPSASNREVKQQFKPELPPKKNQNYIGETLTHVYELPGRYQLYQVEIYTLSYLEITASVNNKEMVYLPLGFEYMINLHPKEVIYLVVDRPESQYLDVSFKKCDASVPTLYYTNDAKEFQKGIYEVGEEIDNSNERKLIKTKKSSKTIHIKIEGQQDIGSIFTIAVTPNSNEKTSKSKIKAGNNGLLDYYIMDASKVEVEFSPLTCDGQPCTQSVTYFMLVTESLDNIWGQLNCAGSYLVSAAKKVSGENQHMGQMIPIPNSSYDQVENKYHQTVLLKDTHAFIGVKAVTFDNRNKRMEVMYVPQEVLSMWNQVTKLSLGIFLLLTCVISLVLTLVIIVSTKLARRGYRPIATDG